MCDAFKAGIAEAMRALHCSSAILDGEAVALHDEERDDFDGLRSARQSVAKNALQTFIRTAAQHV